MSEELDDLIAELADAVHDRATAFEWGVTTTTGRIGAAKQALRDHFTAAERRGAERALRERVAAMSIADCQILESRILRINTDVPYIASEEGHAARIRAAVLAALFPDTTEAKR